jgi:hypothetical protein
MNARHLNTSSARAGASRAQAERHRGSQVDDQFETSPVCRTRGRFTGSQLHATLAVARTVTDTLAYPTGSRITNPAAAERNQRLSWMCGEAHPRGSTRPQLQTSPSEPTATYRRPCVPPFRCASATCEQNIRPSLWPARNIWRAWQKSHSWIAPVCDLAALPPLRVGALQPPLASMDRCSALPRQPMGRSTGELISTANPEEDRSCPLAWCRWRCGSPRSPAG